MKSYLIKLHNKLNKLAKFEPIPTKIRPLEKKFFFFFLYCALATFTCMLAAAGGFSVAEVFCVLGALSFFAAFTLFFLIASINVA